jgi:Leucine-rich repeat (LRR) protein
MAFRYNTNWVLQDYINWKTIDPTYDVNHVRSLVINFLKNEDLPYVNDLLMNDLSKFTQLVQLDINYGPQITSPKLITLPNSITNLVKLDTLRLKNTGIESLPNNIGNLKNLGSLEIKDSNINSLPASFGNLKNLRYLAINNSKLDPFPKVILNCADLEYLDLSNNPFNTVPDDIGELIELTHLDLSNTQIDSLPESIGELDSLESFSISDTKITSLPDSFNGLYGLDRFYITNIHFKSIPTDISRLQQKVRAVIQQAAGIENTENIENIEYSHNAKPYIDFSTASSIIEDLNRRIALKCNNLSIQLGDRTVFTEIDLHDEQQSLDPNQVNLCLYYNQRCISSIVYASRYVDGHGWGLEIMSTTDAKHANNKYNVLLRGVLILVASQLIDPHTGGPMSFVISLAMNPISVWVFVKHFNAIIIKPTNLPFTEETMTKEGIMQYFKDNDGVLVHTLIQLTKENIDNANTRILNLLSTAEPSGFKCPSREGGRRSRKHQKKSRKVVTTGRKRATRKSAGFHRR